MERNRTIQNNLPADSTIVTNADNAPAGQGQTLKMVAAEPVSRRRFLRQAATLGVGLAAATLLGESGAAHAEDGAADGSGKGVSSVSGEKATGRTAITPPRPLSPVSKRGQKEAPPQTLLDEVGHLRHRIPQEVYEGWKSQLRKRSLPNEEAALLHLWTGEYELTVIEDTERAAWHFRRAQQLVPATDAKHTALHGWAKYNEAMTQYHSGLYGESARAFYLLLHHNKPLLTGFSRQNAALWYRHASACAGEHAKLGELGIPRPLKLDPICGAGGLAACFRALKLPYDKKSILSVCRVTGRGSTMVDLLNATKKIGDGKLVTGRVIRADEEALKALPMPMVAFVERDHFVAIVRADKDGVSYLCTDCGHWPGGRVNLTWEQWRAMKPGIFLSVVKKNSHEDRVLALLCEKKDEHDARLTQTTSGIPGVQVAMVAEVGQAGGGLPIAAMEQLSSLYQKLATHVFAIVPGNGGQCGMTISAQHCVPDGDCPRCPKHGVGPGNGGGGAGGGMTGGPGDGMRFAASVHGPSSGDPVNLATLEEEYTPAPDLIVYNPNGPSVEWRRIYNSLRGPDLAYQYHDFGLGWSHPYNVMVYDPSAIQLPPPTNPNEVPQGNYNTVSVTGTQAPSFGAWEIQHNGITVAVADDGNQDPNIDHIGNPLWELYANAIWENGAYVAPSTVVVYVPIGVPLGNYTFRAYANNPESESPDTNVACSGSFQVVAPNIAPSTGDKYVVFENGARVRFSNSQVASASQPVVRCTVESGYGLMVEMIWDASVPSIYYRVTFMDQTSWTFQIAKFDQGYAGATVYYVLTRLSDRVGNGLKFIYNDVTPDYERFLTSGLPTLAEIRDASTGIALLTFFRDSLGGLTEARDCYGRSIYYQCVPNYSLGSLGFYTHNLLTTVSQIVAPGTANPPLRYQYGYDWNANGEGLVVVLKTITVPSPTGTGTSTTTFNYTPYTSFISSIVDANGNVTTFTQVNADGTPYDADPYGDGDNGFSTYTKVSIADPQGNVAYSYIVGFDENMSETSRTDGAGTVIAGKSFGDASTPIRPSLIVDGENRQWQCTWDQYGNLLTKTSPRGTLTTNTWSYSQFPLGRLMAVQEGTKVATTFTYYEPSGLTQSVVSPRCGGGGTATSMYTYDALGNIVTKVLPGNDVHPQITTTRNFTQDGNYSQSAAVNQPVTETDNLGNVRHFRYDQRGNIIISVDAIGNREDYVLNIADQLTKKVFPSIAGTGPDRAYAEINYRYPGGPELSTANYDINGSLASIVLSSFGSEGEFMGTYGSIENVTYIYDATYRRISVTDGNVSRTSYEYNNAGNLSRMVYPDLSAVQFTHYDASHKVKRRVDGRGVVTEYNYDTPDGLISSVVYPSTPALNVYYDYDVYGRRIQMLDATGATTYEYDDIKFPVYIHTTFSGIPQQTVEYVYNPDTSVRQRITPAGTTTYGYDGAGRLVTVSSGSDVTSWSYAPNNWMTECILPNGIRTLYSYDGRGLPVSNRNLAANGSIISEFLNVQHDALGNRLAFEANIPSFSNYTGNTTFEYDGKNRLQRETSNRNGGYLSEYAYDLAGNPTIFKGTAWSYNNKNQPISTAYAYDLSGNPVLYNNVPCTYDPENRLTAFGTALGAGYNGDGIRAWKESGGNRTYFLYDYFLFDNQHLLCTLDGQGNVSSRNIVSENGLVAHNDVYYLYDTQGNVVHRTDSTGAILSTFMYDAWGVFAGQNPDPYGYNGLYGYYRDVETDLLLLLRRYYSPNSGRFINRDPFGLLGGINLYAYGKNNPITQKDPTGLFAFGGAYGHCCGWQRMPEWIPSQGRWQTGYDCIDEACCRHDNCVGPWRWCLVTYAGLDLIRTCDKTLADEAQKCRDSGCNTSCNPADCYMAAGQIIVWACNVGTGGTSFGPVGACDDPDKYFIGH